MIAKAAVEGAEEAEIWLWYADFSTRADSLREW